MIHEYPITKAENGMIKGCQRHPDDDDDDDDDDDGGGVVTWSWCED